MTNLFELIKDNPHLPVYAWVYYEVVEDGEGSWLGEVGQAWKSKIISIAKYGLDRVIEYDDKEEVWEYLAEQDENENKSDEEIWAMVEALPWKECILVWVGTIDSL